MKNVFFILFVLMLTACGSDPDPVTDADTTNDADTITCERNGLTYQVGEYVRIDACNDCQCQSDGHFICTYADCGPDYDEAFDNDDLSDQDDLLPDEAVTPSYELLEAAAAKELIDTRQGDATFHIIDVRTSAEYTGGHIANAQNYNVSDAGFSDAIGALPRGDAYFVYCASGSRSKGAITTMQKLGFLELYELKGGLSSWKSAGYPTETD